MDLLDKISNDLQRFLDELIEADNIGSEGMNTEEAEAGTSGFTTDSLSMSLAFADHSAVLTKSQKKPDTRARRGPAYPAATVRGLKAWAAAHDDHPFPSRSEKNVMALMYNLKVKQVDNW
jgi:hypothetical protein